MGFAVSGGSDETTSVSVSASSSLASLSSCATTAVSGSPYGWPAGSACARSVLELPENELATTAHRPKIKASTTLARTTRRRRRLDGGSVSAAVYAATASPVWRLDSVGIARYSLQVGQAMPLPA